MIASPANITFNGDRRFDMLTSLHGVSLVDLVEQVGWLVVVTFTALQDARFRESPVDRRQPADIAKAFAGGCAW